MRKIIFAIFLTLPFLCMAKAPEEEAPLSAEYLKLVEQADKAISDMKWDEAIGHIDAAMHLEPANPNNVLLMSNKGMLQYYAGEDSLAIETMTVAHKIAPSSTTVLQNRAKVYTAAGKPHEAIADYTDVIALDSTLIEPHFYRAMLVFQTGNPNQAKEEIAQMKRMFPDHQSTVLAEATYLAYTGSYQEAIPLLTQLIEKEATVGDISTRAMCYLMTGDLQAASDDIAKGLELDPTDGELYLYRAMLNKMRYRPDDAKADAGKARMYGVSGERIKALGL